jgi:hypothetical protein
MRLISNLIEKTKDEVVSLHFQTQRKEVQKTIKRLQFLTRVGKAQGRKEKTPLIELLKEEHSS